MSRGRADQKVSSCRVSPVFCPDRIRTHPMRRSRGARRGDTGRDSRADLICPRPTALAGDDCEEGYISAQTPLAQAQAWLPGPDGHQVRAADHCCPAPPGSAGAGQVARGGLTSCRPPLGSGERALTTRGPAVRSWHPLRRRRDFERLYRDGQHFRSPLLTLVVRVEPQPGEWRAATICSKKVGGAVVRNLLKRRLRAVLDEGVWDQGQSGDLALICRPEAATVTYQELARQARRLLARAGLREA